MMIKRYLIIIYLLGLVALSHTQVDLFKDNALDSAFLHSLLEKRVVIIGEMHHLNENVEFQAQTIKLLNENGYRILLEHNIATSLTWNQYINDSVSQIWSFPVFKEGEIKQEDNIYNTLKKNKFKGNLEYFDIKFDLDLNDWGAYVLNFKNDFHQFISFEQIDSIVSYFNENEIISRSEYETLLFRLYYATKKTTEKRGIVSEYTEAFDEAMKLHNKFKIFSKGYFAYRELKIIELLEKKYFQQDDTSKYVIVTGRSHAWLKGFELIKSTFSEYLANKLGRENVSIIISTYPRREYLSNKIKKHLGVNNDDWYNFKQLKKNSYIVKPNPDVDYLLILNE